MANNRSGAYIAGIILIILGIWLIIGLPFTFVNVKIFHLVLGALFLAAYFHKKAYGFLIPGCILLGLSIGGTPSSYFGYRFVNTIYLGLGFIMIYVIDRIYRGKTHWWPLIPGGIIIFTSIRGSWDLVKSGWPILLILLGLYIIYNSAKQKDKDE